MAVQDAEAPGGGHQDPGAGEEDPYQPDGERPLRALEPGRDEIDEDRGREDAEQDEHRDRQREEREERARGLGGRRVIASRPQCGMHRDEGP